MHLASTERIQSDTRPETRSKTWSFAWSWLLGFVLVVYLGLSGGGFDPLVSDQVGIAIWWILLLGVAVGALPRRAPGPIALIALGLFAGLVLWTALGLSWSESFEKTATDLARLTTLLGIFALAILSRDRAGSSRMVEALAAGIFVVAVFGLLSRLHPAWFPEASETGHFLETGRERLSYPLDYWNGLAALIGIGLPLMMHVAHSARRVPVRALAAAALPAMMLALLFTLSRGGIAASLLALFFFLVLSANRLPLLGTMALTGAGGGLLTVLALTSDELVHGLQNSAAHSQGNRLLWITIAVCLVVGLLRAAGAWLGSGYERPRWTVVSRRQSLVAFGAGAVVVIVALLAIGAPHKVSHAWDDFRRPSEQSEKGTSRLTSAGGENRYQFWSSSAREFDSDPLTGTGSGTFQIWWTRDGDFAAPIVDAHNLYIQTLGEIGLVGALLLFGFIAFSLWAGVARTLRAGGLARATLAAAVAGSTVLWTTSVFDWTWKLTIIPAATLLLVAVVLTAGDSERRFALPGVARVGPVFAAVLALIAIAVPLGSESLLRQSEAKSREGDPAAALADARGAVNVEPGNARARLQEALLLEGAGELDEARKAAISAADREANNWRIWLILSRIEAQNGEVEEALTAYRRARDLNPHSEILEAESE